MEGVRPEGPRCEARRAESGGGVLERLLHSGHRRQQPTPTFSQPAVSTDCTALSANYIRPSGFLCCRPDGLELTTD